MSATFDELLDATIRYLIDLKEQGTQFVQVSPETLRGLAQTPVRRDRGVTPASPAPDRSGNTPAPDVAHPRVRAPLAPPLQRLVDVPSAPSPSSGTLSAEAKVQAMAALRERALICRKCPHLAASRRNVVFGVGDINSPLMFVGEAPGIDEDRQGEPFVGKAGQLLTRIIQTMGFDRDTVYIANILKCRPDTPGQSSGNRKPTLEEMHTCLPYLEEQIDLIQPKVIVALGATAVEGLLGLKTGITRLRGQWQSYRGVPVMPTFHPSYLLRYEGLSEKRKVWEDMLQVLERLGLPISEKQRRYFLPSA